jgi:hypothetical protein
MMLHIIKLVINTKLYNRKTVYITILYIVIELKDSINLQYLNISK